MFKAESGSSRFSSATATSAPSGRRGDQIARRGPTAGEIGFVGLGRMGTTMAKNLAAGGPADVERCRPLLDQLGQETFVVGTDPTHASLMKLMGNMLTATALEMLGETAALLRKRGLDPGRFVKLMTSTMFGGRVHRIYGNRIAAQDYAAGFALPLALKDVRLALAEADGVAVPMPSVSVVRDRMMTAIARGYAELDWTALGLVAAEEAAAPTSRHAAP